jgi:gliding motility-associated-like protein
MLTKISFLLSLCLLSTFGMSQSYELYGLFSDMIVQVNPSNGKITPYVDIHPKPKGVLKNLSFHEGEKSFYSFENQTNNPQLIKIDTNGNYSHVGYLKYNNHHIKLVEGLGYDKKNNRLLLSGSLDGGVMDGDYHTEALLEVNITNGLCKLLGFFMMENSPDADNLFVDENENLFVIDANPPSPDFFKIYDFSKGLGLHPNKLYSSRYIPSTDGTILDNKIYFLENRNLKVFDIASQTLAPIGQTHMPEEYNGRLMLGLTKKSGCPLISFSLPQDSIFCDRINYKMEVSVPDAQYLWSTGSTENYIHVTDPGKYWVLVKNSCNSRSDTMMVGLINSPWVELGTDTVLCDNEKLIIDLMDESNNYLWENGSNLPIREISKKGLYSVKVSNRCGTAEAQINVEYLQTPTISLGETITACPGGYVFSIDKPEDNFYWQDQSNDTILTIEKSGKYKLTVENLCGKAEDEIFIDILSFNNIFIPNVFTPNGDAYNPLFIIDERLLGSSLRVFDRWGTPVFTDESYKNTWDGFGVPSGVYFYIIKDVCQHEYKSWLHIIH